MAYCSGNDCYAQVNTSVQFTDTSDSGTSWLWNFGDGNTSNLQNPTHIYISKGDFVITHSTTNECGTGHCSTRIMHVSETVQTPSVPIGFLIGALALVTIGYVSYTNIQQQGTSRSKS